MMEIEDRLRKLELGYTRVEGQVVTIAGDIKDIKRTLKDLAEIAKAQIKLDVTLKAFEQEKKMLESRIEKLEDEVASLKKIAYSAVALATVGMPLGVELLKHFLK